MGTTGHVVTACALAYEMTGDMRYAAYCYHCLEQYKEYARTIVELTNNSIFSGIRNGYISVLKAAVAHAMDRDREGFADALSRLKQEIGLERDRRPIQQSGPLERSLGIIEGYDDS